MALLVSQELQHKHGVEVREFVAPPTPPQKRYEVIWNSTQTLTTFHLPLALIYVPVWIRDTLIPACIDSGCGVAENLIDFSIVQTAE